MVTRKTRNLCRCLRTRSEGVGGHLGRSGDRCARASYRPVIYGNKGWLQWKCLCYGLAQPLSRLRDGVAPLSFGACLADTSPSANARYVVRCHRVRNRESGLYSKAFFAVSATHWQRKPIETTITSKDDSMANRFALCSLHSYALEQILFSWQGISFGSILIIRI